MGVAFLQVEINKLPAKPLTAVKTILELLTSRDETLCIARKTVDAVRMIFSKIFLLLQLWGVLLCSR